MKSSTSFVKVLLSIVLVIGILGVIVLQFVQDPVRKQSDPLIVTQNFVRYVELGQYDKAIALSDPSLRNQPQWLNVLRQINFSIEPSAVSFKELSSQGNTAKVQFYSQPNIVLALQNTEGKWYVMGPSAQ